MVVGPPPMVVIQRDSRCFVMALAPDSSIASTFDKVAMFSVGYINVPLSTIDLL